MGMCRGFALGLSLSRSWTELEGWMRLQGLGESAFLSRLAQAEMLIRGFPIYSMPSFL